MNAYQLPPLLLPFAVTVLLSFLLGLELHSYRRAQDEGVGFGTTRTITLVGVAGFVLWLLGGTAPRGPFLVGLAALAAWLAIDLWLAKARQPDGDGALLPSLIALLAYALGPLVLTQPDWLVAAVVIVLILLLAEKATIRRFSDAFPSTEGVTLAKFLILAGVMLPLMPATKLPGLPALTYDKVWLAVVAISTLSYLGYLANRYIWPQGGTLVTGVLGGLYSSTAATVVLSRQARQDPIIAAQAPAAAVLATVMMYLRLMVLVLLLGHADIALALAPPFAMLVLASAGVALVLWRRGGRMSKAGAGTLRPDSRNPLDLPLALLFATLFVAFAAITQFVTAHYGATGLKLLSFVVGFSDIDPFILSLLAGAGAGGKALVVAAILIASGSNNVLKAGYAVVLSRQRAMAPAAIWLVLTFLLSLAYVAYTGA